MTFLSHAARARSLFSAFGRKGATPLTLRAKKLAPDPVRRSWGSRLGRPKVAANPTAATHNSPVPVLQEDSADPLSWVSALGVRMRGLYEQPGGTPRVRKKRRDPPRIPVVGSARKRGFAGEKPTPGPKSWFPRLRAQPARRSARAKRGPKFLQRTTAVCTTSGDTAEG